MKGLLRESYKAVFIGLIIIARIPEVSAVYPPAPFLEKEQSQPAPECLVVDGRLAFSAEALQTLQRLEADELRLQTVLQELEDDKNKMNALLEKYPADPHR